LENTETYTTEPTKEGIENLEKDFHYVHDAQDSLLRKLFGFVPQRPGDYTVKHTSYIKTLFEVAQEFQLVEGDPRLALFVLEQIFRSPKITDSPKIRNKHKNK